MSAVAKKQIQCVHRLQMQCRCHLKMMLEGFVTKRIVVIEPLARPCFAMPHSCCRDLARFWTKTNLLKIGPICILGTCYGNKKSSSRVSWSGRVLFGLLCAIHLHRFAWTLDSSQMNEMFWHLRPPISFLELDGFLLGFFCERFTKDAKYFLLVTYQTKNDWANDFRIWSPATWEALWSAAMAMGDFGHHRHGKPGGRFGVFAVFLERNTFLKMFFQQTCYLMLFVFCVLFRPEVPVLRLGDQDSTQRACLVVGGLGERRARWKTVGNKRKNNGSKQAAWS